MSAWPFSHPRPGAETSLASLQDGRIISNASRRIAWRHPWFVQPAWLNRTGRWVATIKAGYVNDDAPVFQTTIREQAGSGQDFGINPLTGKPFFSDPIFAKPDVDSTAQTIAIPLTLEPAIPLTFRNVGWDAAVAGEAVPKFFLDRGAVDKTTPADVTTVDDVADLAPTNDAPPAGLRLLRACDLILHQPRLALTSDITVEPGLATGQSHVVQTLSIASTIPGDTLRVVVGTLQPPQAAGIDPVTGDYTEPPYDEILIATVYLLSPPNLLPGSAPDATWQAYVAHKLFWNVSYVAGTLELPSVDPGIGFIPPLAGGVASIVINYLTSAISDILNDALNLVTASSLAGTFWTPTGGGHRADFPASPVATPSAGAGLDRASQIAAQQLAKLAAQQAESLDPAFPYEAMEFDSKLLNP